MRRPWEFLRFQILEINTYRPDQPVNLEARFSRGKVDLAALAAVLPSSTLSVDEKLDVDALHVDGIRFEEAAAAAHRIKNLVCAQGWEPFQVTEDGNTIYLKREG
jgi:hypothetical protein